VIRSTAVLTRPTEQLGAARFVSFSRQEWARLRASTPLTLSEGELQALRGVNEHVTLQQVEEIYLPLSRLLNLYVAATQTLLQGDRHLPRQPRGEGAVRHRRRRQRGGGEEHGGPHPAGPARPVARPPACRPGHDRRLPAAQPRARGARADAAEGLSRELRSPAAARLPDRREGGPAAGHGAGLLASRLRHRARGRAAGRPARHHDPRGAERPADERVAPGEAHQLLRVRLLRFLDLSRRRGTRHRGLVRGALHDPAAHGLPRSRRPTSTATRRSRMPRRRRSRAASGATSTWRTCTGTLRPRASGRTSSCERATTTWWTASGCASSSRSLHTPSTREETTMPARTANAEWKGSLPEGSGKMAFGSGAYEGTTASSRGWKRALARTPRS
jgi:hypothetical protein